MGFGKVGNHVESCRRDEIWANIEPPFFSLVSLYLPDNERPRNLFSMWKKRSSMIAEMVENMDGDLLLAAEIEQLCVEQCFTE